VNPSGQSRESSVLRRPESYPERGLGDTGTRSTVYATPDAAVGDLLALGITPS